MKLSKGGVAAGEGNDFEVSVSLRFPCRLKIYLCCDNRNCFLTCNPQSRTPFRHTKRILDLLMHVKFKLLVVGDWLKILTNTPAVELSSYDVLHGLSNHILTNA